MKFRKLSVPAAMVVCALLLFGSVLIAQNGAFKGFQVGRYDGQALNTTYNQKSNVELKIQSIDGSGRVSATFGVTNGGSLIGNGGLTGTIDGSGVLRLTGPFPPWQISIAANITGQTINANYKLTGPSTQEGHFSVVFTPDPNAPSQPQNNPSSQNPTVDPYPTDPIRQSPSPSQSDPRSYPTTTGPSSGNAQSINGAWKGTYTCAQGLTNLVLSVFTKDGTNVDGIFTFLLGDGASMSVLGSYKMHGTYDSRTGKIDLRGVNWDQAPAGYELKDLSGNVIQPERMSGSVIGRGCTTFQLEKIRF